MSSFYDRLLAEKQELDERREKLNAFLESDKTASVEPLQLSLLNVQSQAMLTYSQVLAERIAWLKQPAVATLDGGGNPGDPLPPPPDKK